MATQLVTPNLDPYMWSTVNGRYQMITDWLAWCMGYVHAAYGNTQKDGTNLVAVNTAYSAHQGWLNSVSKHQDQNFPVGVWVPAWFDYWGTVDGVYGNWGHVVLVNANANGSLTIKSSPISHKATADTWSSIAQVEANYHSKFVGWSEDVCGTKVIDIQGDTVAIIQNADNWKFRANKSFQMIRGRDMSDAEFQPFVGQDFLHLIEALEDNPEADATQNAQSVGQVAVRDNWQKQIEDGLAQIKVLTDQVATLQAQVADLTAKLAETVKELNAKTTPVVTPTPTQETKPTNETPTATQPTQKASPKVIVPNPSEYYKFWELFVALLKKIFRVK